MEPDHCGRRRKVVTSVDVYKEIRRLQLEGITDQRRAAALLGILRNTISELQLVEFARNHHNIRKPPFERPVWYHTSARKSVKNPPKACAGVRADVQEGETSGIRGLCFSVMGTEFGE